MVTEQSVPPARRTRRSLLNSSSSQVRGNIQNVVGVELVKAVTSYLGIDQGCGPHPENFCRQWAVSGRIWTESLKTAALRS